MNKRGLNFIVGCFVLVGIAALLFLALRVGGARLTDAGFYTLEARFGSASGLAKGSRVEIAGVKVGTVASIELNENFFAIVGFQIPETLRLDDDTIASIKTAGLIGDRYISLSPGASGFPLEPGDMIVDTESALDIESLISRFALGGIDE